MTENVDKTCCQDPLITSSSGKTPTTRGMDMRENGTKRIRVTEGDSTSSHEPPDGGWGWIVTVGTTICTMILSTQGPCFGILFGPRLRELQAPPSLAAWLFNFQSMVWNLAGPWTGPLSAKFSYRMVAFIAALMSASSLFISSQVSSPYLLLLTFSVVHGIGGGINITCCFHMTAKYFKERLGVANAIMMTGGSIGIMLLPQLASHLQDLYPFTWATLITGAVTLHAAVGSLLFHPVEWHSRKKKPDPEVPPHDLLHEKPLLKASSLTDDVMRRGASVPCGLMLQEDANARPDLPKRTRAYSECQCQSPREGQRRHTDGKLVPLQSEGASLMGSVYTLNGQTLEGDAKEVGVWEHFRNHYKPSVLRDPLVMSVAVVNCITMVAALNVFSSIPFVLHEVGYTLQESATAMSLAAVVDLVTRMVSAVITDLPQFKPRLLFGFAQFIFISVPFALLAWSDQWFLVLACAGAFGMGLGILYILDVLIMIRLLGTEKFQSVLGMSQLFRSVGFIFIGPVGGAIRDASGNYWATLAFYSCSMLVAFLIMLCTAVAIRPKEQSQEDGCRQEGVRS